MTKTPKSLILTMSLSKSILKLLLILFTLMAVVMNVIKIINFVADKKGQTSVSNGKVKEEPVSLYFHHQNNIF